jgi:class 3 adenylate cyclase
MIVSIAVACTFVVLMLTALFYDRFVHQRDDKVKLVAVISTSIVSSYFPGKIRHHIMKDQGHHAKDITHPNESATLQRRLSNCQLDSDHHTMSRSKPIASLFLDTTVLFADIAGFTQWSAPRPPEQVFELLETLFRAFDELALRHDVYKVETIGDCYVAVTGLPDPQPAHAETMILFAAQCLQKMRMLVPKLGRRLGNDTNDLALRIGVNSGHVTAGVLRGDRARFQLFGDTVNTAAQLEHCGAPDRIHVSSATARYLETTGKEHWLTPRSDTVAVTRMGAILTFWVAEQSVAASTETDSG